MEVNKIYQGEALETLKTLPNESINCIMTSPPYWSLRDYGVDGQLGLETTFQEYINKLCDIFDEVKRVLRKDGTCWVNIGDSYSNSGKGGDSESMYAQRHTEFGKISDVRRHGKPTRVKDLPPKSLCNIPARFSIEMQNRGWILRNVIIWHKPNCMPCSVKDRFTVDFEYLYFFVKSKKYFFETQYEPIKVETIQRNNYGWDGKKKVGAYSTKRTAGSFATKLKQDNVPSKNSNMYKGFNGRYEQPKLGRNKRAVWTITTKPFKEAHFATFPEALCETPIKAGCPERGIVLDPFFGAGTTGLVALKQNKNFIGIELNPEYIKIAEERIRPFLEQEKLK